MSEEGIRAVLDQAAFALKDKGAVEGMRAEDPNLVKLTAIIMDLKGYLWEKAGIDIVT